MRPKILLPLILPLAVSCISYVKGRNEEVGAVRVSSYTPGESSELLFDGLPGTVLYGEVSGSNETPVIEIESVRLFSNWPHGWSEITLDASAAFILRGGQLTLASPLELFEVTGGSVRYYEQYYRDSGGGTVGTDTATVRYDRIDSAVSFLGGYQSGDLPERITDRKELDKLITPLLFPETVPAARRSEPYTSLDHTGYAWGAGYQWSQRYSETLLPQNLRTIRDSGSLWRDYEEAPDIWISLYNLSGVLKSGRLPSVWELSEPA